MQISSTISPSQNNVGSSPEYYQAKIVPALIEIQRECGYLKRDRLEQSAEELNIPLHRLQAVASFFPHFKLTEPKKFIVRFCRDMACHLKGTDKMLKDFQSLVGPDVDIEGVSCLGRCDRAPACLVSTLGHEHDNYYLGRTAEQMKEVIIAHQKGEMPKPDLDADLDYRKENFTINAYGAEAVTYAAVYRTLAIRDEYLDKAAKANEATYKWKPRHVEQFRHAAAGLDGPVDDEVKEAVKRWNTVDVSPKTKDDPTNGGWSEFVMAELDDAALRGLGGAGIPTTQKLRDVRDAIRKARKKGMDDRGFIVVNGDESEPGTFKDREILLRTPHSTIEGVIIAGLLTGACQGFIYIRHEYTEQIAACDKEILHAEELGVCGLRAPVLGRAFPVATFASPGGYICGEQSALIEAMSDRRGEPRNLPPKLETNGLINLPTIVSNVETYSWIPYITINTGKTYANLGSVKTKWKGKRLFSISGDVKRPGVYEVRMGMTLRKLIMGEQYCQGIVGDKKMKAFAPSGPSGGFLPAKLTAAKGLPRNYLENEVWKNLAQSTGFPADATELDILDMELELDFFRAISPTQALGAGLVVYSEDRNMAVEAVNSLEFYRNESCGKCVPCRTGSQKLTALGVNLLGGKISADRWKTEIWPIVTEMGKAIELSSICGLGRSVPVPMRCAVEFFPKDIEIFFSK